MPSRPGEKETVESGGDRPEVSIARWPLTSLTRSSHPGCPPPAARTRAPATLELLRSSTAGMDGIRFGDTPKRCVGGTREPTGRGPLRKAPRGLGKRRAKCRSHHPEPPATVRPPFIFADRYAVNDDYEPSGPASGRPPIHD